MKTSLLLTIDSLINLGLGVLLVASPRGLASLVGVPLPESAFYPSILGGVLFGVGVALWLERSRNQSSALGLGLGGAIAINISGAVVLAGWLLLGSLGLPLRGYLVLWSLVIVLAVVSLFELIDVRESEPAASQIE